MHRSLIHAVAAATLLIASAAQAGPNAPSLTAEDLIDRVEAQGFRGISEVEREGNYIEIKAVDRDNRPVELKVDGATGEVVRVRSPRGQPIHLRIGGPVDSEEDRDADAAQ
ncbi:MAG: PepSY domain-containing protein [Alphaproteobacteria bacterium]|nr:PepSY domain-containing protein [Alphaproteobacteria bacterium]